MAVPFLPALFISCLAPLLCTGALHSADKTVGEGPSLTAVASPIPADYINLLEPIDTQRPDASVFKPFKRREADDASGDDADPFFMPPRPRNVHSALLMHERAPGSPSGIYRLMNGTSADDSNATWVRADGSSGVLEEALTKHNSSVASTVFYPGAMPTNKFWANLLLRDGNASVPAPVYPLPYALKIMPSRETPTKSLGGRSDTGYGIQVSFDQKKLTRLSNSSFGRIGSYVTPLTPDVLIRADEILTQYVVSGHDLFGATVTFGGAVEAANATNSSTGSYPHMTVPIVQGMAYVTVEYWNSTPVMHFWPQVRAIIPRDCSKALNDVALDVDPSAAEVSCWVIVSGNHKAWKVWGISRDTHAGGSSPPPLTWDNSRTGSMYEHSAGDVLRLSRAGWSGVLRVAHLPFATDTSALYEKWRFEQSWNEPQTMTPFEFDLIRGPPRDLDEYKWRQENTAGYPVYRQMNVLTDNPSHRTRETPNTPLPSHHPSLALQLEPDNVTNYTSDEDHSQTYEARYEATLDRHVLFWPTGGELRVAASPEAMREENEGGEVIVEFQWKVSSVDWVSLPSPSARPLLHFAFPHQLSLMGPLRRPANASEVPVAFNGRASLIPSPSLPVSVSIVELESPTKGTMTALMGSTWQTHLTHAQLPSVAEHLGYLPAGPMRANRSAVVWQLKEDVNDLSAQPNMPDTWYFSGKVNQKVASLCLLARELLGPKAFTTQKCLHELERRLACTMKNTISDTGACDISLPTPPALRYDATWGGIASLPTDGNWRAGKSPNVSATLVLGEFDFGNAVFNDHHYHFGYHITAAAVLAHLNPSWVEKRANRDFVWALIRDVSNPSAAAGARATSDVADTKSGEGSGADVYFPPFRYFDWFDGHSWAKGILAAADGKDQESVSEGVNYLYGLHLWSRVVNAPRMALLARTMMAIQKVSVSSYFLLSNGNANHPATYWQNKVSGVFLQNKVSYSTWFSSDPPAIHGIQMIPFTPALSFIRPAAFVAEEWSLRLRHLPVVGDDPSKWSAWTSVIMTNLGGAIDSGRALWYLTHGRCPFDEGLSRSWAMYWALTRPAQHRHDRRFHVQVPEGDLPKVIQ
ncbi:unnamed protein product [Vitrella brassicaformis CCMP3155]|uniref:glucan endo-1,3-beta-D-glucosidase n=2 Tax=Vitrella brassicaformis TaxID=1169539 RepID=A0A0G4GE38_VITBC|nr:unnamed protein product [Vitrella brassicaformis CCMP3155]|eukprot:CEM27590.1 unnamed protein product [Vitrella brassicaformis CCMP3155]